MPTFTMPTIFARAFALAALGFMFALSQAKAQEFQTPVFGWSLEVDQKVFGWQGATREGDFRKDTYAHTIESTDEPSDVWTLVTMSAPSHPAVGTILGTTPTGAVDKYLTSDGSTTVLHPYTSTSNPGTQIKVRGVIYTLDSETTTVAVTLGSDPPLNSYVASRHYSGPSAAEFTVSYDGQGGGVFAGNETGIVHNGATYIDGIQTDVTANDQQMAVNNGSVTTTYRLEEITQHSSFNGAMDTMDVWTSNMRWVSIDNATRVMIVTVPWNGGIGTISGSEGGVYVGSYLFNYSGTATNIPLSAQQTVVYFGTSLVSKQNVHAITYSTDGVAYGFYSCDQVLYQGADSASMNITTTRWYDSTYGIDQHHVDTSGWTRLVGHFNGTEDYGGYIYNPFQWTPRSESLYAPRNLLVDGELFTFVSGYMDHNHISDYYENGAGNFLRINESFNVTPYQHFVGKSPASVHMFNESGLCYPAATGLAREGTIVVGSHLIVPATQSPRSVPFFVESATLLVDGMEYVFNAGYNDSEGNQADVYVGGGGTVSLFGREAGSANVVLNGGYTEEGLENGEFNVTGHEILYEEPLAAVFPEALLFDGNVAMLDASVSTATTATYITYSSNYMFPVRIELTSVDPEEQTYSVGGEESRQQLDDPSTWEVNESIDEYGGPVTEILALTGPAPVQHGKGVFVVTRSDGLKRLAIALNVNEDDGATSFILPPPSTNGLPPGLKFSPGPNYPQRLWQYVGHADLGDGDAAWYGSDTESGDMQPWFLLLKMALPELDGQGAVASQDIAVSLGSMKGVYKTANRLFQTSRVSSEMLCLPIFSVNPATDYTLWQPMVPPNGLPSSFRGGDGQLWRFSHEVNGDLVYLGQHAGQELVVEEVGDDGYRLAHLTDSETGLNTQGTFSDERQSIHMRNGMLVYVNAADAWGTINQSNVAHNQLITISGDLDITGNIVTFGTLLNDASRAGAVLQFDDRSHNGSFVAAFHSILSRPHAEWTWQRAGNEDEQTTQHVMRLDVNHRLSVYSRDDSESPAILLNPAGASYLKGGALRVFPAGDVPMASDFRQGPPPGQ